MGDSRISISVILTNGGTTSITTSNTTSVVVTLPADSALSELVDHIKSKVLPNSKEYTFEFDPLPHANDVIMDGSYSTTTINRVTVPLCIYDCTLYPPLDVTPTAMQFNQPTGPNSKTLQSLQWFPSAKLVIFKSNDEQARESLLKSDIHLQEDYQYNLPATTTSTTMATSSTHKHSMNGQSSLSAPTLIGHAKRPLPSQLFQAVQNRFENDETLLASASSFHPTSATTTTTTTLANVKRRTETERRKQIDARLQKLDENGKQSKVSAQVKKMLIKSRAEGDKKIRVEDRFYLETVLLLVMDDDSDSSCGMNSAGSNNSNNSNSNSNSDPSSISSTHRFYSRSSNVGKIVSSATKELNLGSDAMAELVVLVKHGDGNHNGTASDTVYRRLPNTMPLYEAERSSYLSSFDRAIVRVFRRSNAASFMDNSTPLVGSTGSEGSESIAPQPEHAHEQEKAVDSRLQVEESDVAIMTTESSLLEGGGGGDHADTLSEEERAMHLKIKQLIQELDGKSKTAKKKKTAATAKVRQILLKSKSKGDKKVPEKDLFYFEVLFINGAFEATVSPLHVSKYDAIGVVTKSLSKDGSAYMILADKSHTDGADDYFSIIPNDVRCMDAEKQGLVKSFDRIVVKEL